MTTPFYEAPPDCEEPWLPADSKEFAWFKGSLCRHCTERSGEGNWEDEFGRVIPGECHLHYYAFAGPTAQWAIKDGKPSCVCFSEDATNPAPCPFTLELPL